LTLLISIVLKELGHPLKHHLMEASHLEFIDILQILLKEISNKRRILIQFPINGPINGNLKMINASKKKEMNQEKLIRNDVG